MKPDAVAPTRLRVSHAVFVLCWWLVILLHLINGLLVLVIAGIYLYFSRDAVYVNTVVLQIPQVTLQVSGWSYLVVAMLHGYSLLRLIVWSIQRRSLSFHSMPSTARKTAQVVPDKSATPPFATVLALQTLLKRSFRSVKRTWRRWFGVDGLVGVNGRYFYPSLFLRETTEILLQTYQAHQLSRSVARPSINAVAVAVIVINCLSSPLILTAFRKRNMPGRFVNLVIDMMLDLCSANIIPLAVVIPYMVAYDTAIGAFPRTLTQDDAWFLAALEEIRQLGITSVWDYVATLLPHVSVLSVLYSATHFIQTDSTANHRRSVQILNVTPVTSSTTRINSVCVSPPPRPLRRVHRVLHLAVAMRVVGRNARMSLADGRVVLDSP